MHLNKNNENQTQQNIHCITVKSCFSRMVALENCSYSNTGYVPTRTYTFMTVVLENICTMALQWCHNERDDVSNHHPQDCLLNRLFKAQIKESIKAPRHWPLCGEFTGDRWIPHTKASNAENVSIWWRHHGYGQRRFTISKLLINTIMLDMGYVDGIDKNAEENRKRPKSFKEDDYK